MQALLWFRLIHLASLDNDYIGKLSCDLVRVILPGSVIGHVIARF